MKVIQILGYALNEKNTASTILKERLLRAKRVIEECQDDYKIIVSGGNPDGYPEKNQARYMKSWLKDNGVPEVNIVVEDSSMSTIEQLLFLRDFIDEKNEVKEVIIVGTEGGFKERIERLSKYIIPSSINFTVEGATLPEDITDRERELFTKVEEKKLEVLIRESGSLDPNIDPIDALREMAKRYREGDWEFFEEIGYAVSPNEKKEKSRYTSILNHY